MKALVEHMVITFCSSMTWNQILVSDISNGCETRRAIDTLIYNPCLAKELFRLHFIIEGFVHICFLQSYLQLLMVGGQVKY